MNMEFYGKTIFITGATGCAGKILLRSLLKEGWTVKALARSPSEANWLTREGAEAILGDITDAASLQQAFQGSHFVFHLYEASNSHSPPPPNQPALVESAKAASEAALRARVERFIYLSDSIVYGYNPGKNIIEETTLSNSHDPAIAERVRAEQAVRKAHEQGLPAIILQPTTIYGPHVEAWTLSLLRSIEAGTLSAPQNGKGLLQPIYIYDVIEAILTTALVGNVGQTYLLPGSEIVTCQTFLDAYAHLLGKQGVPLSQGGVLSGLFGKKSALEAWQEHCLCMESTYNGGKAYFDMGFLPRYTLEAGLQRTADWLRHRSGEPAVRA